MRENISTHPEARIISVSDMVHHFERSGCDVLPTLGAVNPDVDMITRFVPGGEPSTCTYAHTILLFFDGTELKTIVNRDHDASTYNLPGGHEDCNHLESPFAVIQRELQEELGIAATRENTVFLGMIESSKFPSFPLFLTYAGRGDLGESQRLDSESVCIVSLTDLLSTLPDTSRPLIDASIRSTVSTMR